MANLIDDLGNALETAIKADTNLRLCFPDPAGSSAYAVEYNSQHTEFAPGIGRCFIRPDGQEIIEDYEESAKSTFRYDIYMQVIDTKGADGRLPQCLQGIANTFKDRGVAILDTHFTDNGSNRLGSSGEVRHTVEVDPLETVNPDAPIVWVRVEIDLWHAMSLS